jgi:phosphomevalonate kinase
VTVARAPGKVVLSGAYAVLTGSPGIVCAVARDVIADSGRPATRLTDEVRVALRGAEQAPWFDASALRRDGRKLGLGSSAAILVASLFALEHARAPELDEAAHRQRVFERALEAHRVAQGGGSGIDVACSTFGGTLIYRVGEGAPTVSEVRLPTSLTFEIWVCPSSASTPELIGKVHALRARDPSLHAACLGAQAQASQEAASAIRSGDARALLSAFAAQYEALLELGRAAEAPIVTPELSEAAPVAAREGGVLLPAGAGGGDIALFIGRAPSTAELRQTLEERAHRLLPVALEARGASRF